MFFKNLESIEPKSMDNIAGYGSIQLASELFNSLEIELATFTCHSLAWFTS